LRVEREEETPKNENPKSRKGEREEEKSKSIPRSSLDKILLGVHDFTSFQTKTCRSRRVAGKLENMAK
jgi:tRNA U38,U39,U40 pseudouridine synthase TruA